MKTYNFYHSCLIAALLLAATSTVRAQGTNAPAPNVQPRVRPLPPGGPVSGPLGVLTEEQRASFRKNMEDQRENFLQLEMKLRAAQQQVMDAMFSSKLDEKSVRDKVMAAAQIEADMAVLRAKAFADIQPSVTPEQLEKMKAPPERPPMNPAFHPPAQPAPSGANHESNGLPPKQ